MEPFFMAQITLFGSNFAPRYWAFCYGQLLPINSNQALFSLLGTIYGGDGRTTFGLPDFRGRMPIGVGNGPGLSNFREGQSGGRSGITLNINELPAHQHTTSAEVAVWTHFGKTTSPDGAVISRSSEALYALPPEEDGKFATTPVAIPSQGGGQAISNYMPSMGSNFIIALQGIFPSRS